MLHESSALKISANWVGSAKRRTELVKLTLPVLALKRKKVAPPKGPENN